MSVVYWTGAVDGDWQDNGNWDGDIPVAADEVIFDGRSAVAVTDGIAVGETGGLDFDLLHFKTGHTGDVGTVSERLHTSAQKILIEGSGTYYIEVSENATGQDQSIPLVIINNKSATVYLTSNENTGSWCCEFIEVIVLAGTVYIGDTNIDTAVQYLRITPIKTANVSVIIHEDCIRSKATAYNMTIFMKSGTCTMDSAVTLIELFGGIFNYGTDLGESPETDMNITTLRIHGGTFNWYPDDSGDDAYIGNLWLFGGSLNASGITNADRSKALGNGVGNDTYVFEGATLNIANGRGNITIKPGSQLWNFDGNIFLDNGTQVLVIYNNP